MNTFLQPRNSPIFYNVTLTQENMHVKHIVDINLFISFLRSSTVLCYDALCTYAHHEMSPGTNSWTWSMNSGRRIHVENNFHPNRQCPWNQIQGQRFELSALKSSKVNISQTITDEKTWLLKTHWKLNGGFRLVCLHFIFYNSKGWGWGHANISIPVTGVASIVIANI